MSSADDICKQFGTRSGPTMREAWSRSKPVWYSNGIPERYFFKKKSDYSKKKISRRRQTRKHARTHARWYSCMHTVHFRHYSKTCLKRSLKNRQNKDVYDKCKLNEGRKNCRMLPLEHSAILLTYIQQQSVLKINLVFFLSDRLRQAILYSFDSAIHSLNLWSGDQ